MPWKHLGADLGMLKGGAHSVQAHRKQFCSGTGTAKGSAWRHVVLICLREEQKNLFTFIFPLLELALVASLCFALHC